MKNKTKKKNHEFNRAVEAYFRARGAQDNEGEFGSYHLRLQTKAGPLVINPHETWIAMRFLDIEKAKSVLPHGFGDRLNPYSGKYNLHMDLLDNCLPELDRILEPVS